MIQELIKNSEHKDELILFNILLRDNSGKFTTLIKKASKELLSSIACIAAYYGRDSEIEQIISIDNWYTEIPQIIPNKIDSKSELNDIASFAAFSGYVDIVNAMINLGASKEIVSLYAAYGNRKDDIDEIDYGEVVITMLGAAFGGHSTLLDETLDNYDGTQIYQEIAEYAVLGGHLNIVNAMIKRGADNYNTIACSAAEYGHIEIVKAMIKFGAKNHQEITISAAKGGCLNIVDMMVEYGVTNCNSISKYAAGEGHTDIVFAMFSKGDVDLNLSACFAAGGGHEKLVFILIGLGATDYDMIARGAAKGGHKDIVISMVLRGVKHINSIATDALVFGHKDLLEELVLFGADNPYEPVRSAWTAPFFNMVKRFRRFRTEMLVSLLSR